MSTKDEMLEKVTKWEGRLCLLRGAVQILGGLQRLEDWSPVERETLGVAGNLVNDKCQAVDRLGPFGPAEV